MWRPIEDWDARLIDLFLDAWWDDKPGLYNEYHLAYDGKAEVMIRNLRRERQGSFQMIWDYMTEV